MRRIVSSVLDVLDDILLPLRELGLVLPLRYELGQLSDFLREHVSPDTLQLRRDRLLLLPVLLGSGLVALHQLVILCAMSRILQRVICGQLHPVDLIEAFQLCLESLDGCEFARQHSADLLHFLQPLHTLGH